MTIWDGELREALAPYRDDWVRRVKRYDLHRAYYAGVVYRDRPELRRALGLYNGVRQIFSPLRRAVRIDVAKVPGDWRFAASVPDEVRRVINAIRAASDYRREYAKATLHGAVCGEFGLMVSVDPMPRIHALPPDAVIIGEDVDGTPFATVMQPNVLTRKGRVERALFMTPFEVRVYENGMRTDARPNLYGVIPVWRAPYLTGIGEEAEGAFSGVQELLDRVNDLASQVIDVIQSQAEPILAVSGVSDVHFEKGDNVLLLPPPDAKAYPINPQLIIDQATALLDRILEEFKRQLPQLSLDAIQSRNDLAYQTVTMLLNELIDHIVAVRQNVDAAIVEAERAAAAIGAMMQLWDDADWSLHALDAYRPVFAREEGVRSNGTERDAE